MQKPRARWSASWLAGFDWAWRDRGDCPLVRSFDGAERGISVVRSTFVWVQQRKYRVAQESRVPHSSSPIEGSVREERVDRDGDAGADAGLINVAKSLRTPSTRRERCEVPGTGLDRRAARKNDGLMDNVRTRGCGEELDTHETLSGMRKNGFRPTSHRKSRTASAPACLRCTVHYL